jgi:prevent-host-death family protein
MAVFTVQTAKADLDQLIARAEAGEEIVISRADRPAVRLTPVANTDHPKLPRQPGRLAHLRGTIPDSFFDPLSEEELKLWEDGPIFPPDKDD